VKLNECGMQTSSSKSDADLLIVQTVIEWASEGNGKQAVLVGEDTNLTVLTIALGNVNDKLIMFKPGRLSPKYYMTYRNWHATGIKPCVEKVDNACPCLFHLCNILKRKDVNMEFVGKINRVTRNCRNIQQLAK